MPQSLLRLVLLCAVMAIAAACGGDVIVGGGAFTTHANGVRTYQPVTSINGHPVGCTPVDRDQVRGTIASDAARPIDSVWLKSPYGDIHVVWPGVLTFAFDDQGVRITDEGGRIVAVEGDEVGLRDRPLDEAAGTVEDPYVAWGRINDAGCYAYLE